MVNKEIEKLRNEGKVGSSLEAEVTLYCEPDSILKIYTEPVGKELRFILITSNVEIITTGIPEDAVVTKISNGKIGIKVKASTNPKCARCWHRRADVGNDSKHPEICERCIVNIEGAGEERYFA